MDFAGLLTDFYGLGFDSLDDGAGGTARAKRYLNSAYKELVLEELWSFRETDTSGAAPLTISDLGVISSVVDTATNAELAAIERQTLVNAFTDLTVTGSPSYFYVTGKVVNTYPVGETLAVHYWLVPPDLSAPADTMIVPGEYEDGVIFGAGRRAALREAQDVDLSNAYEGERQRILKQMTEESLAQVNENFLIVGGQGGDW